MTDLTLLDLIKTYPIVWAEGEPLLALAQVDESMNSPEANNDKIRLGNHQFWNLANGLIAQPFSGTVKQPMQAEQDLVNGLMNQAVLIVMGEGLKWGPHLQAALLKVIHDDRRAVIISSGPPPEDLLKDYLRTYTLPYTTLADDVEQSCTINNHSYDERFLPPLRGLRPFRASSTLLELLRDGHEDILPELYAARRDSLSRDTDGVITMEEPPERYADLIGLDRAKRLLASLSSQVETKAVRGALLLGVPGTGKTMLARATAGEARRPLYQLDIGASFGSLVGESERKARRAISALKESPPGIVLVD